MGAGFGTATVARSSGRIRRNDLLDHGDRVPGGDRAANSALHMIAVVRLRYCERTQTYAKRRIAEGRALVRAALLVRLNGIARGGSGASPPVAETLAAMLNAGVHPVVPRTGSVGTGDLPQMAAVAMVAIGMGSAEHAGEVLPGGEALRRRLGLGGDAADADLGQAEGRVHQSEARLET